MTQAIISLSHLSFGPSGRPVLDDINLRLEPGHFLGIVGPNGAGKSTLLKLVAGFEHPSSGHIKLFGEELKRFNRRRLLKQVGYLHQLQDHEPRLPMRVKDVVAMGLNDYASPLWNRPGNAAILMQALEQTGMHELADTDFRHLSGGQRQRVRLARALVRKPKLLLLDEPSAALDNVRQEQLFSLLRQLCDETGMAIIMVEHDIAAISSYVDSVACLNRHIHHHALKGENIPEAVWQAMYGEHVHVMAHDAGCIGCKPAGTEQP